jgi:hypothetical protein
MKGAPQDPLPFDDLRLRLEERVARDMENETDDAGEQRFRTLSQAGAAREVSTEMNAVVP